jgi:hypothetical protein
MPTIDVSDLLTDPDLADTFTVLRRQQVTGSNGTITTVTTPTYNVVGVVGPSGDNSLARQAAFETQGKSIQVITKFRLRGATREAGNVYQPDIVVWGGDNFLVVSVSDFTRFGVGFVSVDCTSMDLVDVATAPPFETPVP